jgi:hypothetical protein
VKAGEGTMKQGYRDVGYLFAPHIRRFKPAAIPAWSWLRRLRALAESIEARNQVDVEQWFHRHYPQLMELIPPKWHESVAAGVIERGAGLIGGEEE